MKQSTKNQIKKGAEEVSEALIIFGNKLTGEFKKFSLILLLLLFNVNISTPGAMGDMKTSIIPEFSKEQLYVNSVREKTEIALVIEVDRYIQRMAPKSGLSPELLVGKCVEYDTDIIFVLAQALLESHFGTKGKAAATNSVWNVGTYDNGRVLYRYKTADESLEPYLKLLNEKYLINISPEGDTIFKDLKHLVSDKGYVNYAGKRFASARGYENAMRKLMITIDMETSIKFYQELYILPSEKLLSYFAPINSELNPNKFVALR